MLVAPRMPGQVFSGTGDVIKTFVRVKEVTGGVACLKLGNNSQLHYRAFLSITPVNFALMSEDDQDMLIEGFKSFLNGLSFPIQVLVRNLPYRLDGYLQAMEAVQGELAEMALDHADFVRQLASKRALVKRMFYVIVPADHTITIRDRHEALSNAQTQLKLRIDELLRQLERLGITGQRLDDREIIALYQSFYLSEEARKWPVSNSAIQGANRLMVSAREPGLSMREAYLLAMRGEDESDTAKQRVLRQQKKKKGSTPKGKVPDFVSTAELIAPSSIELYPWYMHINGEAGQEYVRTLAFMSYPRSAYPGWLDAIIQIDEPFVDFSLHIEPLSPEQVNMHLGRKATEFRGSVLAQARQGKSPDPTTAIALGDVEGLRAKLARGDERIFNLSLFVLVRGQTRRELSERNNRVISAIRSLDFRALPTHWQHHIGFLSCLPDLDNQLGRGRLFGTSSAATFYPFTSGDISMESGVLFGVHPSGGLVILNPFNSEVLENANLVVFAKSGAGKSFFLKTTTCRLLPTCQVYVIDPEAEYNNLCEQVRGQYIRLSSTSLQLNPFDLYKPGEQPVASASGEGKSEEEQEEQNTFFREKLLNLVTLFELLLGDGGALSQKEKAFLHRCLVKTYANRGISGDPTTHGRRAPNMQEFYLVMSSEKRGDHRFAVGEDSYGLSERMERYLHLFPAQTSVELTNRFVDFNIRELNDTLKPIGLFLITEFLWTRMRQARQARVPQPHSIVLIDEAWLLMQFPQGARFLAEFSRRIRKYGGGLWCTTQNSDDFLGSEEGRTILAMATMKFLMKQDSSTIESVARTFRLSSGQRNFLLAARRGEGLFATKSWTPMEVVASPREAAMANTTVGAYLPAEASGEQEQLWQELAKEASGFSTAPFASGKATRPDLPLTRVTEVPTHERMFDGTQ
jgi:hypothetical protein